MTATEWWMLAGVCAIAFGTGAVTGRANGRGTYLQANASKPWVFWPVQAGWLAIGLFAAWKAIINQ